MNVNNNPADDEYTDPDEPEENYFEDQEDEGGHDSQQGIDIQLNTYPTEGTTPEEGGDNQTQEQKI